MSISALPEAPSRAQPSTFADRADAFLAALPTFRTEANALAAAMTTIAAGGAMAIPYIFSTTTADADPGDGYLRLNNATQNLATVIRADLAGADGSTWTSVLDTFDDSTNTVKGFIRLVKTSDASKWIVFSVSALASPTGYKNITVAVVAASSASPFVNGDMILMHFSRTGDKGDTGATGNSGLVPLQTYSLAGAATVDVEGAIDSTYDRYILAGDGIKSATSGQSCSLRAKLGGAYQTGSIYNYRSQFHASYDISDMYDRAENQTSVLMHHGYSMSNESTADWNFEIELFAPSDTATHKNAIMRSLFYYSGDANAPDRAWVHTMQMQFRQAAALTGLRIYTASGTFSAGTLRLYGVKKP